MKKERTRTLKLVLSAEAYDVTGTPQKMYELINPTKWIKSRLYNKDGTARVYDFI